MIKNVKLKVVGVTFDNEDGTSRQSIIKSIGKNEKAAIFLKREPNNPYDRMAVAVYSVYGQVGYISKDYAKIISQLMDSGEKFVARVAEIDEYKDTHYLHIIIDQIIPTVNWAEDDGKPY